MLSDINHKHKLNKLSTWKKTQITQRMCLETVVNIHRLQLTFKVVIEF